jgi:hypothetical protein
VVKAPPDHTYLRVVQHCTLAAIRCRQIIARHICGVPFCHGVLLECPLAPLEVTDGDLEY